MTQRRRSGGEHQPGGRDSAPGRLALVQAFLNSRWDLDGDHDEQLQSPAALARWLRSRDLLKGTARLHERDLERALEFREGLRALLFVNNGKPADEGAIGRLNRSLERLPLRVEVTARGAPRLIPNGGGLDGALAAFAGIVTVAQVDGSWRRLKACPGVHCGWAFYDHSRNQSGSWCSMSVCGSRAKAREYRRRKRTARGR